MKAKLDMLLGVPGDVEKLEAILEDLSNVLGDAEWKRISDTAVDGRVRELKDIMYDADDVLDQWLMAGRSSRGPRRSSSLSTDGCFVLLLTCFRDPVFAHDMAEQIKELNRRLLESVCKWSSMFQFVKASSSPAYYLPRGPTAVRKTIRTSPEVQLLGCRRDPCPTHTRTR